MKSELFNKDIQVKIPLTTIEFCKQRGRLQHSSKPRFKFNHARSDVEVLKFSCKRIDCPLRVGEVIAAVRGDTLDQALANADKTAKLVREVAGCVAEKNAIVIARDVC